MQLSQSEIETMFQELRSNTTTTAETGTPGAERRRSRQVVSFHMTRHEGTTGIKSIFARDFHDSSAVVTSGVVDPMTSLAVIFILLLVPI